MIESLETKTFEHKKLGVKLVLRKSADELVQRDVDAFMAEFQRQPQGGSLSEDNGKTVRAAFKANWIATLTTPAGEITASESVDGMKPAHVRWAAQQIDSVFYQARDIPNE